MRPEDADAMSSDEMLNWHEHDSILCESARQSPGEMALFEC